MKSDFSNQRPQYAARMPQRASPGGLLTGYTFVGLPVAMETVATKVPREMKARAAAVAKRRKVSLSRLLRSALENEIRSERPRTWGDRFGSLQGAIKGAPANLSEIEGFD